MFYVAVTVMCYVMWNLFPSVVNNFLMIVQYLQWKPIKTDLKTFKKLFSMLSLLLYEK